MGNVNLGVPKELALALKTELALTNFVETGTYLGDTAVWASKEFQTVYTIEASLPLYEKAVAKLGHHQNIRFLHGDSRKCLRNVVQKLNGPALYWLDAHWSAGNTFGENDECPLLQEIAEIHAKPHEAVIFVDDARLFLAPPPKPHNADQWPDLSSVIAALLSADLSRYVVVYEDAIISVPAKVRPFLVRYIQDRL
jgi:hypothetical protein